MSFRNLVPGAGPVLNLKQALYRAAQDYHHGLKGLAFDMALDYDALQKKLHVDNPQRYLTPAELEEVVRLTKDERLLAALVRPAGAVAYLPTPVPATQEALAALGELLGKEATFVGSLHGGAADGRWEQHEVDELRYRANQVISVILGIVAGAEQAMEGADHG